MSIAEAAPAPDPVLKNETFDELKVGESASLVRIVGRDDIDLFAAVSGDVNPAHLAARFAATDLFGHVVTHGMWTAALVSAVLGTKLPGPGTIYLGQDLRFLKPVAPGGSSEAILGAVEVQREGLLEPLLIGPEDKIQAAAEQAQVSLQRMAIEPAVHGRAAAARAVELAAAGQVALLVKGSLHTDELLGAVVAPDSRLRTERRISNIYAMDLPAFPKPLIITDAAINVQPTLEHKRDICQNAIDLMHVLGLKEPLVAVVAAVETVNPRMPATLDAAALAVMAARGQITGARVDGPLAFDNAISPDAARTKGIVSPVAGNADILLVPDLEAGNMLAKQLIYFADAIAAGLVLGARVPIVLTSRADPLTARIASAALAKLVAAPQPPAGLAP
jgi:phosphate acetyltransferase